jgi:hypothetical protein
MVLSLAILAVSLAMYVAAYRAMLKPGSYLIGGPIPGTGQYKINPVYRLDNDFVRICFWPANQADRRLFPQRWSTEILP